MATIQEKFASQIPALREDIKNLVKTHGADIISQVTVAQAYGGMRGVKGLVCDTSLVDPEKGLIIRGKPVVDLTENSPEEVFYLLLTGELPDAAAVDSLQDEFTKERVYPPMYGMCCALCPKILIPWQCSTPEYSLWKRNRNSAGGITKG